MVDLMLALLPNTMGTVMRLCYSHPYNFDALRKEPDMLDVLKTKIRDIRDFPSEGILFKDITPLLEDPQAFSIAIDLLAHRYIGRHIDRIVCIEARGFILGSALAYKLNAGL